MEGGGKEGEGERERGLNGTRSVYTSSCQCKQLWWCIILEAWSPK